MKFTKFGKALLMGALSTGVILGVTSCVRSYTVGYIYVTGTVTAQSTGNGIISGYKIDHNTGFLTPRKPAAAPAASVRPSMIEASNRASPSTLSADPRPALKSGSSSNRTTH